MENAFVRLKIHIITVSNLRTYAGKRGLLLLKIYNIPKFRDAKTPHPTRCSKVAMRLKFQRSLHTPV